VSGGARALVSDLAAPGRLGAYALPERRRRLLLVAVSALALAALGAALGVSLGSFGLPAWRVPAILLGGGEGAERTVVMTFRLPRVAAALTVGAALSTAGALTQTVTRNPLASPDILGLTSGASVGAVSVVVLGGTVGQVSGLWASVGVPMAAVAGAFLTGALVAVAARRAERVVLVGVGVSAAAQSLVTWLLVVGDVDNAARAAGWLAGSLNARSWTHVQAVALALVLCAPLLVWLARSVPNLALGDEAAAGTGVAVERVRWGALAVATVLAGTATAAAGPIAFVGLAAPQIAARLAKAEHPPLLASAVVGAAAVALCDLLARSLFGWFGHPGTELPVGILTAALGAAYLISLVTRKARA
jgi:iron complex transport system permease protein